MGVLLGLAFAGTRRSLCEAQATLYFPPPTILEEHVPGDAVSPTPKKVTDAAQSDRPAWAQETLTSKEAVDAVCKKIERSGIDYKTQALRSAVLLSADQRVIVETLPQYSVRLKVYAEDSRVALLLCESLLAYLTFKTKIPLENPDPEALVGSERQLRIQEKSLAQALWGVLAFDSPKSKDPNALQAVELDLQDYYQQVAAYRQALRDHFFRETRAAAIGPNFIVLEPPSQIRNHRPWIEASFVGGGLGLVVSAGFAWLRRRRRRAWQNVHRPVQEPPFMDRTASPGRTEEQS